MGAFGYMSVINHGRANTESISTHTQKQTHILSICRNSFRQHSSSVSLSWRLGHDRQNRLMKFQAHPHKKMERLMKLQAQSMKSKRKKVDVRLLQLAAFFQNRLVSFKM